MSKTAKIIIFSFLSLVAIGIILVVFYASLFMGVHSDSLDAWEVKRDSLANLPLSPTVREHYNEVYNWKGVVGLGSFQSCDDEKGEHLDFLRSRASKDELLFMLDDTSSIAFKVFVIAELHKDEPELDSMLLQRFENDTSTLKMVSGCMGLVYFQTFGETCKNIITYSFLVPPEDAIITLEDMTFLYD